MSSRGPNLRSANKGARPPLRRKPARRTRAADRYKHYFVSRLASPSILGRFLACQLPRFTSDVRRHHTRRYPPGATLAYALAAIARGRLLSRICRRCRRRIFRLDIVGGAPGRAFSLMLRIGLLLPACDSSGSGAATRSVRLPSALTNVTGCALNSPALFHASISSDDFAGRPSAR